MDSLSKKIQNLGIHDIRNAARFAQNMIVQYEPYQVDIRRATNTDSWGPTPKHLDKVLRNRYQIPLYLMTEYTLKRLVDHIATRPKNLYEKARKDYVNYGSEWRVVLKCLVVIEFLLLNVGDGDELNQVRSCLTTHKHLLTREVSEYRIPISNDGKMEVHERGIKRKCENILQLLEDTQYLKKERKKYTKNHLKIRQQTESSLYNANPLSVNTNGSSSIDAESFDDDDVIDDEAGYDELGPQRASQQNHRRRSNIDEQRRQRREILRERIKNTESQRKNQQRKDQQQAVPDLIDFDLNEESPKATETKAADDEEDDDFGDFQSGSHSNSPKITPNTQQTNGGPSDLDLLDWGATNNISEPAISQSNTNGNTNGHGKDDAFANLFSYSKSLI